MIFRRGLVRRRKFLFFHHWWKLRNNWKFRFRNKPPIHQHSSGTYRKFPLIKLRFRKSIILIFIFSVILFISFWIGENHLQPSLKVIAKTKVKTVAQKAFLKGIHTMNKELNSTKNQLIFLQKDKEGRIIGASFNSQAEVLIYNRVTESIMKELHKSENHIIKMSLGEVVRSSILSDIGMELPLNIWVEGVPHVVLTSKIESSGINTSLVIVYLQAEIDMGVLIPFTEEHFKVKFSQPIVRQIIVGDVPSYFPPAQPILPIESRK
ncbi:sporulation protein YunB [Thermoflavimicrobium daqui]|nr:sporulation protein YunB [Thermoflavimicrobium daqui]